MAASTIEEIFNFAIDKEREAIAFYEGLAGKAENPVVKDAILRMADEERKHEKMLMNINLKKIQFVKPPSQEDMKLSNYVVEPPATKDMGYPDLLVIAMKREEKAYELYSELETRAGDDATRKVFTLLKGEELKHKTKLEKEYEDGVLREG
ncbi:MAG: ferritin family protein [Candidatus Eisenbacteria bacterium]